MLSMAPFTFDVTGPRWISSTSGGTLKQPPMKTKKAGATKASFRVGTKIHSIYPNLISIPNTETKDYIAAPYLGMLDAQRFC